MSKQAEHTPGPWHASGNGVHIRKGTVGFCVATSHDPHEPSRSTDVCHANARLIAAAPDLLSACEALLDIDIQADHPQTRAKIRRDAHAAIARARGTTP